MALTDKQIEELEAKGFNRWTKGNMDRLYVNAGTLGLECTYYNTGNINHAKFNGNSISNNDARRIKYAKTYIDVKTGELHADRDDLKIAAQALMAQEC